MTDHAEDYFSHTAALRAHHGLNQDGTPILTPAELSHLEACRARLASGVTFPSADAYYADKNDVRTLEAKLRGKTARQHDPVGFHHGMQSN